MLFAYSPLIVAGRPIGLTFVRPLLPTRQVDCYGSDADLGALDDCIFERTFSQDGPLGLQLCKSPRGAAVVSDDMGTQPMTDGDQPVGQGDVVLAIAARNVTHLSYDKVLKLLASAGRPVTVTFMSPASKAQVDRYYGEASVMSVFSVMLSAAARDNGDEQELTELG